MDARTIRRPLGVARRTLLIASAALPFVPAAGQDSSRATKLIVGYPPGGGTDTVARLLADNLSKHRTQPVIVDNRSGAAGALAAQYVARSAGDGNTILIAAASELVFSPASGRTLPYSTLKDFKAITLLAHAPLVLVVHPSIPATRLRDLVQLAGASKPPMTYSSFGPGASNHFIGELFKTVAKVHIEHVPYRGSSAALNDLLAGHVNMTFDALPALLPSLQAGKVRAIAILGETRSIQLPDVPTFAEAGMPNMKGSSWFAALGPASMSDQTVASLAAEFQGAIRGPVGEQLRSRGLEPVGSSPREFDAFLRQETDRWSRLARTAGILDNQ